MVVYGHTPVPEPEWLNRTVNVDTLDLDAVARRCFEQLVDVGLTSRCCGVGERLLRVPDRADAEPGEDWPEGQRRDPLRKWPIQVKSRLPPLPVDDICQQR
jgi:hypothetical protein